MNRTYVCIDLKSFYASVECVLRGLDPLNTNLVVADLNRTEKTICLAVTPSLKKYGLSGRSRLYEVFSKVKEINKVRLKKIQNHKFTSKSYIDSDLENDMSKELDFIIAPPRMRMYMKYSTMIYDIYLKYISRDDIFSYSIDEVFMDVTDYLNYYKMNAKELVTKIINNVYSSTGITATSGIGTNMYLAKIAMDIVAKHKKPDKNGARIAFLNETEYRRLLWNHTPLTDFWRFGSGTKRRLENYKIYTMKDIAICSLKNEKLLYKIFGINAEIIIDHAWGYEICTIKSVKSYRPQSTSLSSSQVLHEPYTYEAAKLILKEMIELLVLEMVSKRYMTNLITIDIIYDVSNLTNVNIKRKYNGEIVMDHYRRFMPKPSHGSIRLEKRSSSTKIIMKYAIDLFEKIANPNLLVRKIGINFSNLLNENIAKKEVVYKQFDLFSDTHEIDNSFVKELVDSENENKLQKTIIDIKNKYGKNSILKAMNLEKYATTINRNKEVGGHMG